MTVSISSTLLLLAGILLASTLLSFPLAHADQVAEEAADGPDRRTRRSGRVSKPSTPYDRPGAAKGKRGKLTAEKARLALESVGMEAPEAAAGAGAAPSDRIPPRDECPKVDPGAMGTGVHLAPRSDGSMPFTIFHWNLDWMFSPNAPRAEWARSRYEGREKEDLIKECPQRWEPGEECDHLDFSQELEWPSGYSFKWTPGETGRPETERSTPCTGMRVPGAGLMHPCMKQWGRIKATGMWIRWLWQQYQPNVISLNEIDGCTTLKNLLEASGLNNPQLTGPGVFWPYHYMGNDYRSNQQGVDTSDFPVTSNKECQQYSGHERGKDYNFKKQGAIGLNKNVMLGVDVYGRKIALLTVHLKSIPNAPANCMYREVEAKLIDQLITSEIPEGYEIILLGDFNDYDDKDPLTRDMRRVQREGRFFQHPNSPPDPALDPGKPDTPYMDSTQDTSVKGRGPANFDDHSKAEELDAEDEREYYRLVSADQEESQMFVELEANTTQEECEEGEGGEGCALMGSSFLETDEGPPPPGDEDMEVTGVQQVQPKKKRAPPSVDLYANSWVFQMIKHGWPFGPGRHGHRHNTKREMFNTNMALSQDKRWSLEFMKASQTRAGQVKTQIDFIFVSRDLFHCLKTFKILNPDMASDPDMASNPDKPYFTSYGASKGFKGEDPSDHFPVVAHFDFKLGGCDAMAGPSGAYYREAGRVCNMGGREVPCSMAKE
ncbi:unnamed protein product [Vitrella brassicaformis CCMP3155]|uniref:Endonuclease/exonuclease/phosphatase domain-containing protein n=1 Tax=Vitrella brassicaformis (strain CCMP3155) TaxID=1169540 RepID=A0A0G4G8L3_VITBC|nr:unnamed protein product [Vitrella brassicaformis CCMP3155]|eukprot:CEM25145.1 unnamed protein product [Vitrella brassicaformis CCMP3155]